MDMGRFSQGLARFMQGRYGSDKLNLLIIGISFTCSVTAAFLPYPIPKTVLMAVSYGLLALAIFRMLSRKTYKRYRENKKFLDFFRRLGDRKHRYFRCPKCRQQVRVPKKKGKIAITCPKCREKFIKKT